MNALIPFFRYLEIGTFVLLIALSIWSVAIMVDRRRVLRARGRIRDMAEAEELMRTGTADQLRAWSANNTGIMRGLVRSILEAPQQAETIDPAARSYLQKERQELERGLSVLATLGSNAPFIGLFGTVLGIIEAFSALSADQTGSQAVMASIAQALIATALGLFVAIPAVVAFNTYSGHVRRIFSACDSLKNFYLSRLPARK
jgi:biopolymer transport protein ExbB